VLRKNKNHSQLCKTFLVRRNSSLKNKRSKHKLRNNSRKKKPNHFLKLRNQQIKDFWTIFLEQKNNSLRRKTQYSHQYKRQEQLLKNSTTRKQDKRQRWQYKKLLKTRHLKNKAKKQYKMELVLLFKNSLE
jgi:hypothetical protein